MSLSLLSHQLSTRPSSFAQEKEEKARTRLHMQAVRACSKCHHKLEQQISNIYQPYTQQNKHYVCTCFNPLWEPKLFCSFFRNKPNPMLNTIRTPAKIPTNLFTAPQFVTFIMLQFLLTLLTLSLLIIHVTDIHYKMRCFCVLT